MEVLSRIDQLTDEQVRTCVATATKNIIDRNRELQDLLRSEAAVLDAIGESAPDAAAARAALGRLRDGLPADVARLLLKEMATSPDPNVSGAANAAVLNPRARLLDPISAAGLAVCIVVALSTHVKIDYADVNGRKSLRVKLEKRPTADALVAKIVALLA